MSRAIDDFLEALAVERGASPNTLAAYRRDLTDIADRLTVRLEAAGTDDLSALMDELLKIVRVLKKIDPEAPHETLLVLDATVGRNALEQEKIFGRTAYVSGVVMTKLDGTARGGVLVPVAQASDAPIKLIGVGEGVDDLQPFDARAFSRSLVGLED